MALMQARQIRENVLDQLGAHEQKVLKEMRRAEQRLAEWRSELELIRELIARTQQELEIDSTRSAGHLLTNEEPEADEEVRGILLNTRTTPSEKIRQIAIKVLQHHGKPMKRRDLFEAILRYDLGLHSDLPREVVRKALERSNDFERVGRGLYALKEKAAS